MARVIAGLTLLVAGGFFGLYLGKKTIGFVQKKTAAATA